MKFFIILILFVGTTISCRDEYQSCSKNSKKEECCPNFECRKPRASDLVNGNNAKCFKIEQSTTTDKTTSTTSTTAAATTDTTRTTTDTTTTATTTTTKLPCRIEHQSCSNVSNVAQDTCCAIDETSGRKYTCRSPKPCEFGYENGKGNTRCFVNKDDDDMSIENEETSSTTSSTTPATTASTSSTTTSSTTSSTTEANTSEVCMGIDQFCENENCCGDLVCIPIHRNELATCNPPAEEESTPTSTIEIHCATKNQECRLKREDCCQGLECRRNGTSSIMGSCQQQTWPTTSTTERTTTQETCRQRGQTCDKRGRGKKCCDTHEKLQCRRNRGKKQKTCQSCSERFESCKKSKDCCQYSNQEENICHRPYRKARGTCGPKSRTTTTTTNGPIICQQKNGFCQRDLDCCRDQEDLYCEQNGGSNNSSNSSESGSGESGESNGGSCIVRVPTTITTTQTSTTTWCQQKNGFCQRDLDCCRDQEDLYCEQNGGSNNSSNSREKGSGESGESNVSSCQVRVPTTTTTQTPTTSNWCQQKNGFCRRDLDCCRDQEDLYCEQNGGSNNSSNSSEKGSGESNGGSCQVRVPSTTQTSTTPWCSTEGQECENTSSCCYEQGNELECTPQLEDFEFGSGNLDRKTCQRPSPPTPPTTTAATTTATTTTLMPIANECSSRGNFCPNQTDDECCRPWKCISVDGKVWLCGERGVNGTSIS